MIRPRQLAMLAGLLTTCASAPCAAAESERGEPPWAFSASANTYVVPDDDDFLQPTVMADRKALHLEARYNYEALQTSSAWIGYNLEAGESLALAFTPMLGGIVGETSGIAPGYHLTLGWRSLEFYSEGEYVVDFGDDDDSFFYSWSQFTLSPVEWLTAGFVAQRTRTYDSPRDVQPGLLLGLRYDRVTFTGHIFNPDEDKPLYVFALGASLQARGQ